MSILPNVGGKPWDQEPHWKNKTEMASEQSTCALCQEHSLPVVFTSWGHILYTYMQVTGKKGFHGHLSAMLCTGVPTPDWGGSNICFVKVDHTTEEGELCSSCHCK